MPEVNGSRYMVNAGWQHVPHLDETTQAELLQNTPPHLRDARSKGIPSMGAGAIYPIEQSEITVQPFAIPAHWPKAYGQDVGWEVTAAIFAAWDRDADVVYLYSEHYRKNAEPSIHADAIKARGEWLTGACDYAGGDQSTGQRTIEMYRALGLKLVAADKSVEVGIEETRQRLMSGRLKVFSTCQNWLAEHRLYRRDEKGRVVKKFDHLMDATRYLIMALPKIMQTRPVAKPKGQGFVAADSYAGY